MISIRVRYMPASNSRGARLQVTNGKNFLYVPYQYGNDEEEKYQAAEEFRKKFHPTAPQLHCQSSQYMGYDHFHFVPKVTESTLLREAQKLCQKHQIHCSSAMIDCLVEAIKLGLNYKV